MKIEIPYNLLILSAFRNVLKYENKKDITLKILEDYINEVLKIVLSIYKIEEIVYSAKCDKWEGNITFNKNDNYIRDFLKNYSSDFKLENDSLKLISDVDYEDLWQMMNKEMQKKNISNRFLTPLEDLRILEKLNIKKIPKIIEHFFNCESKIEKLYLTNKYDENLIGSFSLMRVMFLNNLGQYKEEIISSFLNVAVQIQNEQESAEEFFPVDFEAFKKSPYYVEPTNLDEDNFTKMCSFFNKAIFGNFPLYYEKAVLMLEDVYEYQMMASTLTEEDLEEAEILESTAMFSIDELSFCLTYIEKIDEFISIYGHDDNLESVRNRLIYIIDNPVMELFDEEVLESYILEQEEMVLEEPLSDYQNEVYFMCEDIFHKKYSLNTIKEIIFISSYYQITHDEKVIALLNKYQNNTEYDYYSRLILGDDKDQDLSLTK